MLNIKIILLISIITFSANSIAIDTFTIKNTLQDKCLDVSGYSGGKGQNVMLYHCDGYDDQRWYFADESGNPISISDADGSFYTIRNVKSNLCLDVSGHLGLQNDTVKIWTCESGYLAADQKWKVYVNSIHFIYNGMGKCLDVAGTSGSARNNVQLWGCVGNTDQNWYLDDYEY